MSRRFSLGVSSLASLLICLFVPLLAAPTAAPAPTRLLRQPTVSATHIAFAYANNIWVGRARRRRRAAPDELSGRDDQSQVLARRPVDRVQRRIQRQRRRLRRPGRRRRAEAADLASGRRRRAGLDARRQVRDVRVVARDVGAERRGALLDRAGRRRHRTAAGAAARLSGQDLARRHAHRVSHEQFVGRRAAELSGRAEPADLDRRPQDVRSRLAAVDRLEGRRSRLGRRRGLLPLRSRRRRERLGVSRRERSGCARSRSSPTST